MMAAKATKKSRPKPKEIGVKYSQIHHRQRHMPESIRFGRGCVLRHKGSSAVGMWADGERRNAQRWEGHVRTWTVSLYVFTPPRPVADARVEFKAYASHQFGFSSETTKASGSAKVETAMSTSWEHALEELHRLLDALDDGIVAAFPERARPL
jgi:hypothetical protein